MIKIKAVLPYLTLIILGVFCFFPGTSAVFQLDDWPNLGGLKDLYHSGLSSDFWLYVTEKIGVGGSGRPIALLSFALQADYWPNNPKPFLMVNLFFHILNACLVYYFLNRLCRYINLLPKSRSLLILAVAILWLTLPMHVSGVLYVVQRMTILSATFVLLGLCGYLKGRQLLELEQSLKNNVQLKNKKSNLPYLIMSVSVTFGGILAVFSKESGILLVAYILALEFTLLRSKPVVGNTWHLWKFVFLWSPLLLLSAYFLSNVQGRIVGAYVHRDFDVFERLLTQPRVLLDYVRLIIVPRPQELGLFQDGYVVSKSLLQPLSTLYCLILLGLSVVSAYLLRKKVPVWSFCVFWFIAGHLIESSFISLELYFEHRNYLPSIGILFGAVYLLFWLPEKLSFNGRKLVFGGLLLLFIGLHVALTYQQATLWGKPLKYAAIQYKYHPESVRAKAFLSEAYLNNDAYAGAAIIFNDMINSWPEMSGPYVQLWYLHCLDEQIEAPSSEFMIKHLKTSKFDFAALSTIKEITALKLGKQCPSISDQTMHDVLFSMLNNTHFSGIKTSIYLLLSDNYLDQGEFEKALAVLDSLSDSVDLLLRKARYTASKKQFDRALSYIEKAEKLKYKNARSWFLQYEVERLKKLFIEDRAYQEKLLTNPNK